MSLFGSSINTSTLLLLPPLAPHNRKVILLSLITIRNYYVHFKDNPSVSILGHMEENVKKISSSEWNY